MTSKEALEKLNFECIRSNGVDDEYAKELNIIKKDLEVLEIIKKYLVRTFDYPEGGNHFCLELHKFIYEKEGMKFREWLKDE